MDMGQLCLKQTANQLHLVVVREIGQQRTLTITIQIRGELTCGLYDG